MGALIGGGVNNLTEQDNCDTQDSDSAPVAASSGKVKAISIKDPKTYLKRIKAIAKAVAPKVGVSARILFAQLYAESGPDGSQPVATKDLNFGGMTWTEGCGYPKGTTRGAGGSEGGYYRHYKTIGEFASDWARTVKNNFAKTGKPKSINDYVQKQKSQGYMASNQLDAYATRMKKGYSLWTGKSTVSGSAQVADLAATDTGENCDNSSNSDDNFRASGDILKEAKKWIGQFSYSSHRSANAHWKHPSKTDTTDCSGFVWLVLKRAGYKVPSQTWATPGMETDARKNQKYLKQISSKNAKKGDILIVNVGGGMGQSGHTAILTEDWHGDNTKIIEMGGDSTKSGVNVSTVARSFTSLLGSGRRTYARPQK